MKYNTMKKPQSTKQKKAPKVFLLSGLRFS